MASSEFNGPAQSAPIIVLNPRPAIAPGAVAARGAVAGAGPMAAPGAMAAPGTMAARRPEGLDLRPRFDTFVGARLEDVERALIEATLDYFQGDKRRSAEALGCSLKTLYNKLNGYSQGQEFASS